MDVRDRRIASAPASPRSVAECVSGVLARNGAVLVEKRRADDEADPGMTLLPGGHVEPEESLDQALKRKIREELGIRVEKTSPLHVRLYTASNGERQRIHGSDNSSEYQPIPVIEHLAHIDSGDYRRRRIPLHCFNWEPLRPLGASNGRTSTARYRAMHSGARQLASMDFTLVRQPLILHRARGHSESLPSYALPQAFIRRLLGKVNADGRNKR